MKRAHVYYFVFWIVLGGLAGCPLPEGERDSCTGQSDCLDGYVCNTESARCELESPSCSGGPMECGDETVLLAGQGNLREVIVGENHLYWIESGGVDGLGNGLPWAVRRLPLHGGAVETLTDTVELARDLVADETHVYWASEQGVHRFDKRGVSAAELFVATEVQPRGLVLNRSRVYYRANGAVRGVSKADGGSVDWRYDGLTGFTVDEQFLYVFAGDYQRVALDGSTPAEVLAPRADPSYSFLRKYGEFLYVQDPDDSIWQLDVEDLSGLRVVVRTSGDAAVRSFVFGGDEVFASVDEPSYHAIVRASIVQPAPHADIWRSSIGRGDGETKPLSVAIDADYIYWANGYSGTIHRHPR